MLLTIILFLLSFIRLLIHPCISNVLQLFLIYFLLLENISCNLQTIFLRMDSLGNLPPHRKREEKKIDNRKVQPFATIMHCLYVLSCWTLFLTLKLNFANSFHRNDGSTHKYAKPKTKNKKNLNSKWDVQDQTMIHFFFNYLFCIEYHSKKNWYIYLKINSNEIELQNNEVFHFERYLPKLSKLQNWIENNLPYYVVKR